MMDALAALVFAGFVVSALLTLPARPRPPLGRAMRVQLFIAYTVAASMCVGALQWDLWPFVSWPLVAGDAPRIVEHPRLVAVDVAGAEHDIDPRAWQPLSIDELMSWTRHRLPELDPDLQQEAFRYLLARAEQARARAVRGKRFTRYDRWLGPVTAPLFLLHPRRWKAGDAPALPFTSLRLYLETWDVEVRDRDPAAVSRRILTAYPATAP